mmetsp:Transcript_2165/g.4920  ORF Transcript_2165/g.4920 Transcript_2165/m.4920 type:complete len:447 (+) Transcript_2165:180-1520(+)
MSSIVSTNAAMSAGKRALGLSAAGGGEGMFCNLDKLWQRIGAIESYAHRTAIQPMTMQALLQTNSYGDSALIKNAEWVRQQLSIRLAHRLYDFHRLPFIVIGNPFVRQTYDTYYMTFAKLLKVPSIDSKKAETDFIKFLEEQRGAHDRTVDFMGQGLKQLQMVCPDLKIDAFLDRFFLFRISRRTMIDHLVALHYPRSGWAGCINLECKPADVIRDRAEEVRESCRHTYGIAPLCNIGGNINTAFPFIPEHLSLIVIEILKNSMRATVEFYTMGNSLQSPLEDSPPPLITDESELPPVVVDVFKGKEDVIIKISDKGGGIPPAKLAKIWEFGYSTVSDSNANFGAANQVNLAGNFIRADMAGYGFGLPLSRAFARYFGGDLTVQSYMGVGTDVIITLNHIGDQVERLALEERPDLHGGAGACSHVTQVPPYNGRMANGTQSINQRM